MMRMICVVVGSASGLRPESSLAAIQDYFEHGKQTEKKGGEHNAIGNVFFVGAGGTRHVEDADGNNLGAHREHLFTDLRADSCDASHDESVSKIVDLSASPDVLEQQFSDLNVNWKLSMGEAESYDWVGLYSPASESDNDQYVDFVWSYNKNSNFVFRPLNLRDDRMELRYFRAVSNPRGVANSTAVQQVSTNGNEKTYKCLARSNQVRFRHSTLEPMAGRLEFTINNVPGFINPVSGIRVTWNSGTPSWLAPAFVEYRKKGASTWKRKNVERSTATRPPHVTYSASDLCESPANVSAPSRFRHPGFTQTTVVTTQDLGGKGEEMFEYRFGQHAHDQDIMSSVREFRSPPTVDVSKADDCWSFLAYADHGTSGSNINLDGEIGSRTPGSYIFNKNLYRLLGVNDDLSSATTAAAWDTRFILHFGDLAYAWSIAFTWDLWHREIEPFSSKVPYMITIGNHEYDYKYQHEKDPTFWQLDRMEKMLGVSPEDSSTHTPYHPWWGNFGQDSKGECGVPVYHRWRGVGNPDNSTLSNNDMNTLPNNGPFWYSFSYKNVHVIQLSSEHDLRPDSLQYKWLVADLAKVDRKVHPWIIATAHRPAYKSESYAPDRAVADALAASLDPVFLKYKVDMFLTGHYHDYERTCPVTGWGCVKEETPETTVEGSSLIQHLQQNASKFVQSSAEFLQTWFSEQAGNSIAHEGNDSRMLTKKETSQTTSAPVHICVGSAGAWTDHSDYSGENWSVVRLETVGFLNLKVNGKQSLDVEFWGKPVTPSETKTLAPQKRTKSDEHGISEDDHFKIIDQVTIYPYKDLVPGEDEIILV